MSTLRTFLAGNRTLQRKGMFSLPPTRLLPRVYVDPDTKCAGVFLHQAHPRNIEGGWFTMPDDMYEDYEEQLAFQYDQQQRRPHRDAQRLTNTTNAALPNHSQRAASQRQAETEARQRNLRVPPDELPRGRGRNHDTDYATAQPPRSTLPHRPINGADLEAIPGVQFHKHNEPFIPRSTLVRGLPQGTYYQQQVDTGDIEEYEQETQRPQPPKRGR